MTIKLNDTELDASTTRAIELVVRQRELYKDMRGFLGSQHDEVDDRYLIDEVRKKASDGIIAEAAKTLRREESNAAGTPP